MPRAGLAVGGNRQRRKEVTRTMERETTERKVLRDLLSRIDWDNGLDKRLLIERL